MTGRTKLATHDAVRRFAALVGCVVGITGVAVLCGWAFDITVLKSLRPNWVTMKANTAFGFVLCGLALLLFARHHIDLIKNDIAAAQRWRWIALLCTGLIALIGLATLAEYLLAINLGIDELLFLDSQGAQYTSNPGRMSPTTALNFVLVAGALYFFNRRTVRSWYVGQCLTIIGMFIAYTAIFGYALGIEGLYRITDFTSIALHTAVLFMLAAIGILALQPSIGIARLIMGVDAGGLLARRLLPAAFLLSPLFAWLRWQGQLAGFYDTRVGIAIYASSNVIMFTALIWWTGFALQRKDMEKTELIERIADKTEQLQRFSEALERSNVELRRFAYVASHDLQTPLRAITSFTQLIQKSLHDKFDADTADWMRRVILNTERMQTLIRNLLDYARMDARARTFTVVDLNVALVAAIEMLSTAIKEAGAEIKQGTLPMVHGDASQLTQLLQNLIGNALKYRGNTQCQIEISVQDTEREHIIAIRDNGIGIEEQHQARVFELFQRLHSQHAYPGTGIGLALCRRVVQYHGGRIWVESHVGKGSTFYFTIPVTENH